MASHLSQLAHIDRAVTLIVAATLALASIVISTHSARAADAPGAKLWALEPIARPALPPVRRVDWAKTPIDRFILARLEERGWEPAGVVSRAKLIRRVYFDLCGLPPTPEEVRTFVADPDPTAYERLIDTLLASPHYGERWGRYWLDLVRFAETNGYERDALKPNAWQYRDWVIHAFNEDLPYDQFVTEQLAGDELPDAGEQARIATGFLRIGTFDDEPNDPLKYKFEQLDDLIHATSTAFLAITLKCARCHDHKFDPIPQTDYYAVLNFFAGGKSAEGPLLTFASGSDRPEVRLLEGGDPNHAGAIVPAGFLSMVGAKGIQPIVSNGDKQLPARTQLARWITSPDNPLAARVIANRLWQHHFGEALVRTPDNFGKLASAPTHPELLDWLSSELVAGGWRLKRLHRMILLSATYQMDSTHARETEYGGQDFDNKLWWRTNRRRLEAEPLRDAMLAVSGQLNVKAGGPSFFPPASKEALEGLSKKGAEWGTSPPDEQRRRSIYMMTKRSLLSPLMTTFDSSDTTQPCSQRNVSIVAPQALALLNNEFVHAQSDALANRVVREAGGDLGRQIEQAWWLALGREPSESERGEAERHVATQVANLAASAAARGGALSPEQARQQAFASLCHVLFNTNEFIYVD
jgi:hypothetical protein